jgi:hypothetical protein
MAYTYSKLAESTVGVGGAATITFNNIPQNYTDLVLKVSLRGTATGNTIDAYVRCNGSTISYTTRYVYGNGSSAGSSTDTLFRIDGCTGSTATASTFGSAEMYIPNYTGTAYKSASVDSVIENNATAGSNVLWANLWSNVTAISSLILYPLSGSFVQYSTATLYGIRVEI